MFKFKSFLCDFPPLFSTFWPKKFSAFFFHVSEKIFHLLKKCLWSHYPPPLALCLPPSLNLLSFVPSEPNYNYMVLISKYMMEHSNNDQIDILLKHRFRLGRRLFFSRFSKVNLGFSRSSRVKELQALVEDKSTKILLKASTAFNYIQRPFTI